MIITPSRPQAALISSGRSVAAKEEHGYEQRDDDRVEAECDERVTGDNFAGQGCPDGDVRGGESGLHLSSEVDAVPEDHAIIAGEREPPTVAATRA